MDFIYGQLPEIVDDMIYSPVPGNGTATVQIDNENKKISVNVLKTPGTLKINNSNIGIEYNGSKDIQLNIPRYKIKKINQGNENASYKWSLFEYNFLTSDYDINCGDVEFGQDLNIENGSSGLNNGAISSKTIEGIAKGSTAIGIQSFSFGGNDLQYPDSFQVIEIDKFNEKGESIGKIQLDLININSYIEEETTYYDLTLRDRDTKREATLVRVKTTDFIQQTDIPFFAYSNKDAHYINYWAACFTNGSTLEIGVIVNHIQQQHIYDEATYTYKAVSLISSADGNQSLSVGKGTHADADQSQAFGLGTITCWPGQMVIGKYNIPIPEALFIIGNGTDEFHRSNALVVYTDGVTKTAKQIDVMDPTPNDGYN